MKNDNSMPGMIWHWGHGRWLGKTGPDPDKIYEKWIKDHPYDEGEAHRKKHEDSLPKSGED